MDQLANTFGKIKVKQERLGAQLDLLDQELFSMDFIRRDSKPKKATQTDISDTQSNEPVTEQIRIDKPSEPERMEEGSTEQMDVEYIDQILSHETSGPTRCLRVPRGLHLPQVYNIITHQRQSLITPITTSQAVSEVSDSFQVTPSPRIQPSSFSSPKIPGFMTQASSSELISSAASLSEITQTSQIISPASYYQSQQNPFNQPQPFQQPLVQQFHVHQPLTICQILLPLDQPTAQPVPQSLQSTIPQSSASAPPSQQTEQPSAIPKIKRKDRSQGQSIPKHL